MWCFVCDVFVVCTVKCDVIDVCLYGVVCVMCLICVCVLLCSVCDVFDVNVCVV